MIPDDEIRKKYNVIGNNQGVKIVFGELNIDMTPYEAFRFSQFLNRAILDYKRISGKSVDEGFAK